MLPRESYKRFNHRCMGAQAILTGPQTPVLCFCSCNGIVAETKISQQAVPCHIFAVSCAHSHHSDTVSSPLVKLPSSSWPWRMHQLSKNVLTGRLASVNSPNRLPERWNYSLNVISVSAAWTQHCARQLGCCVIPNIALYWQKRASVHDLCVSVFMGVH